MVSNLEPLTLSKRAARRLIQRAFVLAGRDRHLRQHLREVRLSALWLLEDWNVSWTVELDRGRLQFLRRPTKHPDVTLTWPSAEEFFRQVEDGEPRHLGFECQGTLAARRLLDAVAKTFSACLRQVLQNPVDDAGDPLT